MKPSREAAGGAPRPLFVPPGDRAGRVTASAAETGGALGLVETLIPKGHSTPLHVHRDEDEAIYVLTGTVDFVCDDREFRAEAGAFDRARLMTLREIGSDLEGHPTPRLPFVDVATGSLGQGICAAVGSALNAMKLARKGEAAFSLIRPPGHHATQNHAMGFCYFNSIAIAALEALADGVKRVAVLDFDVHHGNGTEAVLVDKPNVAFCSIHQHPCYPGTGTEDVGKNCFNFPVAPRTPRDAYRKVLTKALERVKEFKPELIGVSAGFDCYARDPLAQETLEAEDFYWLGESLRKSSIPFLSALEGGYSSDLPELIFAYLKGVAGK